MFFKNNNKPSPERTKTDEIYTPKERQTERQTDKEYESCFGVSLRTGKLLPSMLSKRKEKKKG